MRPVCFGQALPARGRRIHSAAGWHKKAGTFFVAEQEAPQKEKQGAMSGCRQRKTNTLYSCKKKVKSLE